MKTFKKTLSVFLAILMVLAVTPLTFAAVDTSIIAVGDVVTFGIYEQDDDATTTDALEWIVVGKDGDALKLITKYVIDTTTAFSTVRNKPGTWGNFNKVYTTLIPAFLSSALTEKEKAAIITVDNNALDQQEVKLGEDLVYIPSVEDINTAFATNEARVSSNTAVAAKSRGASAVGAGAQYFLRDNTYTKNASTHYVSYVDVDGSVQIASADNANVLVTKSASIGTRLMTNVDASKLFTTGKDAETGIIPLVGTLGTFTVTWQCKCVAEDGSEKIHVFKTESVDYGDAAIAPDERDTIAHTSNYHQGYDFAGWDQDYSSVTSDMTITAVYEEIPEVGILEQIFNWLRAMFVLLIGIIETEVLPVVNEWLEANLGFQIEW